MLRFLAVAVTTSALRNSPDGPASCKAVARDFILTTTGSAGLPHSFKSCALVGSSARLHESELGKEIDAHDTVIRLNRLPTKEFKANIGQKTDVYFKNTLADISRHDGRNLLKVISLGGREDYCDMNRGGGVCSTFTSLIYEGADDTTHLKKDKVAFPYAYQSSALHSFEHSFPLHLSLIRPSCGMKAIFTFAMLCESLDIYGFGGNLTVDQHPIGHDLPAEHRFQGKLGSEGVANGDFPNCSACVTGHCSTAASFLKGHPPGSCACKGRENCFKEEFAAFQSKLRCMSERKLLKLH